jgi:hypothetical protein
LRKEKKKKGFEKTLLILLQRSEIRKYGDFKVWHSSLKFEKYHFIVIKYFTVLFCFPNSPPQRWDNPCHFLQLLGNFLSTLWKLLTFRNGQTDLNQKLDKTHNCNNNKKQLRKRGKPSIQANYRISFLRLFIKSVP